MERVLWRMLEQLGSAAEGPRGGWTWWWRAKPAPILEVNRGRDWLSSLKNHQILGSSGGGRGGDPGGCKIGGKKWQHWSAQFFGVAGLLVFGLAVFQEAYLLYVLAIWGAGGIMI